MEAVEFGEPVTISFELDQLYANTYVPNGRFLHPVNLERTDHLFARMNRVAEARCHEGLLHWRVGEERR